MEPMGSQGVAKGGPKDALVGPGRAKSAQGSECPGKGQGDHFFGVPFGTPIWLHFLFQERPFFHSKKYRFSSTKMDQKWIPK